MKVILLSNVPSLGKMGEIKEVKEGHALHFLIPRKFAIQATKQAASLLQAKAEKAKKQIEKEKRVFVQFQKKIKTLQIVLKGKANTQGKLFSQISPEDIAKALQKKGFPIQKKQVHLSEPIKYIGGVTCRISSPNTMQDIELRLHVQAS